MNRLIKFTENGKVNMHRTIDQFVFEYRVKKKSDFSTCWDDFNTFVIKKQTGRYNNRWFTRDRLMSDVKSVWDKFVNQEKQRLSNTLKGESAEEIILRLFKDSKDKKIFISQSAMAVVLGTNQMAISRKIKELTESGFIRLIDRGSNLSRKCSTYILGSFGIKMFNRVFGEVINNLDEKRRLLMDRLRKYAESMKHKSSSFLTTPYTDKNRAIDDILDWQRIFSGG